MKRQNAGFMTGNPKDVLSPEQAASMGLEHDVQLEFQIKILK